MTGTIKFYNFEKGFGFIFCESTKEDVYFHINDWKNPSVPGGNDDVEFEIGKSQNGKSKAVNITLLKTGNDKRQENYAKNDDRVICPGCQKKIVPRLIICEGSVRRSVCPYCATEINKFSACFIATAVYEDYNHPQVIVLRSFRDKYLLTNQLGKKFVEKYYKYSPVFANYVKGKKILAYPIKKILDGFVYILNTLHGKLAQK